MCPGDIIPTLAINQMAFPMFSPTSLIIVAAVHCLSPLSITLCLAYLIPWQIHGIYNLAQVSPVYLDHPFSKRIARLTRASFAWPPCLRHDPLTIQKFHVA
ncbi:hypothetical protein ASPFODRAFT_236266 [Aspergillus luchuensis CBS 106.47]|uniref:Uncharacterized protein n=1 Tax=Aspergillus luchuensis (strain CBS 106.47) TaxID=1137211 RepID=A0A1M3TYV6_ASPLC|nr:hypothetical protein ASPFODRAFT_236266 [Aspergillus luchuensis CBS 106.47]